MRRQFTIALVCILAGLALVSATALAAATWLQEGDDTPPAPPRVAAAFGAVASLIAGEGLRLDEGASPKTLGPATLTLAGGGPLELPAATPLYGATCDLVAAALGTPEAAATPPAAGTEFITPASPPCFVQLGLAPDGRISWLLGFTAAAEVLAISGDLRGAQDDLVVLEDGSTVPGAAAALITGCDALEVSTLAEVAALDADVAIRVDPTTGAAIDITCTF